MNSRVLIAAPSSGSGKTTVTCGLLMALKARGVKTVALKSGPDYIDPMFHRQIIGSESGNLDLFFAAEEQVRRSFLKRSGEFAVIEGAMGYYDGIAGTTEASAYHLAKTLDAPVVLVIDPRGMAMTAAAVIRGMCTFREDSNIRGVILNNCTRSTFKMIQQAVEQECGVSVFGFMPKAPECALESRHLGLVTAAEIGDIERKMERLGELAEDTIDIDGILRLGGEAPRLTAEADEPPGCKVNAVIAVARDRAFCFYYEENLELLRALGCELRFFSPLKDETLPEHAGGLYLGGGYPELYAAQLSENGEMRRAVRQAVEQGMPVIGECGGFMYLSEQIDGWPMVGALKGSLSSTGRLGRFGYIDVVPKEDTVYLRRGERIKSHEFHYWDSDFCGSACRAVKPITGRAWDCIQVYKNTWAGFPHLYFESCPMFAERFAELAERYQNERV